VRTPQGVQAGLHPFPGLESRDELVADRHRLSGFGITTRSGRARLHREDPKATKLHPITGHQGIRDPTQDGVHDRLDVSLVKVRVLLGDAEDQFGLDHGPG
jgi:hypothetical protein